MPDGLLAQLGGAPAPEADVGTEAPEESNDEELALLMEDFDDVALPVSERLAALKAALGI